MIPSGAVRGNAKTAWRRFADARGRVRHPPHTRNRLRSGQGAAGNLAQVRTVANTVT